MVRTILLGLSAATAAGLLFVNLYNSVVDTPNWGAQLPASVEAARAYYSVANPGNFFRIVSPLNQVLALVALLICWRNNRYLAVATLAAAILADVMTFTYFYPRNEIMFKATLDVSAVKLAWEQWSAMNWLRTTVCLVNTVLAFMLLVSTSKRIAS